MSKKAIELLNNTIVHVRLIICTHNPLINHKREAIDGIREAIAELEQKPEPTDITGIIQDIESDRIEQRDAHRKIISELKRQSDRQVEELDKLKKILAECRCTNTTDNDKMLRIEQIEALQIENKKLKKALKKYGKHSCECQAEKYPEAWHCICGFSKLL